MLFESYRFQRACEARGEGKADRAFYCFRGGLVQPSVPAWREELMADRVGQEREASFVKREGPIVGGWNEERMACSRDNDSPVRFPWPCYRPEAMRYRVFYSDEKRTRIEEEAP